MSVSVSVTFSKRKHFYRSQVLNTLISVNTRLVGGHSLGMAGLCFSSSVIIVFLKALFNFDVLFLLAFSMLFFWC